MTASWHRSLRLVKEFARKKKAERCELCALAVGPRHPHVVDPETRSLLCSCDACALLFDREGTAKYRRVPRDITWLRTFEMPDEEWQSLHVPIQLGFFYRNSRHGSVIAAYPSPGGTTESAIDEGPWQSVVARNPSLAALRADVEALLVNRLRGNREYFLAPIDRCFELGGIVRTHWEGMSGGTRVWEEVSRYFGSLRTEARS